jgi:hypothetical protein
VEVLDLDELNFRSTWIEIGLFRRSAAREFLQGAPEKPPEELVSRLLNGADTLDDTPGLYRPVTLNMLGLMFQHFDREFTGIPGRQVQAYLETAIADRAIRDVAPRVIKGMITEAATTKQAQSVESLSAATGISALNVRACLNRLASKGLARRLGDGAGLWTLSHDFVARQFALLLRHLQPSPWPRVAVVASPALFALTLGITVLAVPIYMERHALRELQKLNVSITGDGDNKWATFCRDENAAEAGDTRLAFFCPYGDKDSNLSAAAPYIAAAKVYQIDLNQTGITKLGPLSDLTDLRKIDCNLDYLSSLAPLGKLTGLLELAVSTNLGFESLDLTPLSTLVNLRKLDISGTKVDSIAPLAGLTSLQQLDIDVTQVKDLAAATVTIRELQARNVKISGSVQQTPK